MPLIKIKKTGIHNHHVLAKHPEPQEMKYGLLDPVLVFALRTR
jgi:hypothetical protein